MSSFNRSPVASVLASQAPPENGMHLQRQVNNDDKSLDHYRIRTSDMAGPGCKPFRFESVP